MVQPVGEPDLLQQRLGAAGFEAVGVETIGTCTLARRASREQHVVDVLLATGCAG